MTILEIDSLNAFYGKSHVLFDLSIEVRDAGFVTLIGRNGAGKTTTLKSIAGLIDNRTGTITFKGGDLTQRASHEISRAGVALVPEHRRIFPDITVRDNLRLGHLGHAEKVDFEKQLERVHEYFPILEEREDQLAGQMSGGEQQMLAIGRALICDPDLLLVDEPSEGLMPSMVETVSDILTKVNEEGVAVLLVEQDIDLALGVSDYGYVLEEGRITYSGTSNQLENNAEIKETYLGL